MSFSKYYILEIDFNPSTSIVYYYNRTFCLKYIYLEIYLQDVIAFIQRARNLLSFVVVGGIAISSLFVCVACDNNTGRKIAAIKKDLFFFPSISRRSFQKVHSPRSHSLNETRVYHLTSFNGRPSRGCIRIS